MLCDFLTTVFFFSCRNIIKEVIRIVNGDWQIQMHHHLLALHHQLVLVSCDI
jgi:hypothetical protein